MKLLLDMNIPPRWCELLAAAGHECVHWSAVGEHGAPDETIMEWARQQGHVVVAYDLGFARSLALSGLGSPSIIQIRGKCIADPSLIERLIRVAILFEQDLNRGAVVSVGAHGVRGMLLPAREV